MEFSKHVHNRWGLRRNQKFLWIMSDEKWFHALVPRQYHQLLFSPVCACLTTLCFVADRNNAKSCAELGIRKQSYSAHHKKHIGKVSESAGVLMGRLG